MDAINRSLHVEDDESDAKPLICSVDRPGLKLSRSETVTGGGPVSSASIAASSRMASGWAASRRAITGLVALSLVRSG
jgi:hypothetical protein